MNHLQMILFPTIRTVLYNVPVYGKADLLQEKLEALDFLYDPETGSYSRVNKDGNAEVHVFCDALTYTFIDVTGVVHVRYRVGPIEYSLYVKSEYFIEHKKNIV